MKETCNVEKLRRNATEHRFQFVCTPAEFVATYGPVAKSQSAEVAKIVVLCKDGMIRPR